MALLTRAAAWLNKTLAKDAGVSVVLRRGEWKTAGVTAIRGRSDAAIENLDATFRRVDAADFLIKAADYVIDGRVQKPLAGDRIEVPDGDAVVIFELQPFAGSEVWRYSDHGRLVLRVHAKELGRVDGDDPNVQRSILGLPDLVDGDVDSEDRRQEAGGVRVFS